MFELQDNVDLHGSVRLVINHFGDTIILKNLEAMKDFCRVRFFRVLFLSVKVMSHVVYSLQFKRQVLKSTETASPSKPLLEPSPSSQGLNWSWLRIQLLVEIFNN